MNENLKHVEFKGFEPDSRVLGSISHSLDVIMGSAPSDAAPLACMQKTREGFEGFLRLNSQAGTFMVQVLARTPIEVMQRLSEGIFDQIRSWRSRRILSDSL